MAQLRKPRTAITYQKLTNSGSSITSDPSKQVAGGHDNPVTLTVEEMEVLLLIREDLLIKRNRTTREKKSTFPAKAEMARLTRRPESKFKEIYNQLQEKGVLLIEGNNRQYQVGKNCANAFAFIRDHFTDDDKKQIEQYFGYSRTKQQDTLSMKKTSPYLRTEELEELVSIADQLLHLTSPKEVSEKTARLAEIQHAKKHRSTNLIPFEHAYRRFQDEQIMSSLNNVYQQVKPSQQVQKKLADNICRVLGRDPKKFELPSRQVAIENPVTVEAPIVGQNPITESINTLQQTEVAKKPIRKRFAIGIKQAVSATWTTLTPFLNNKRIAKQATKKSSTEIRLIE